MTRPLLFCATVIAVVVMAVTMIEFYRRPAGPDLRALIRKDAQLEEDVVVVSLAGSPELYRFRSPPGAYRLEDLEEL